MKRETGLNTNNHESLLRLFHSSFCDIFSDMESEPAVTPAIIFSDSAIRDQATGKLTLVGVFQRFKATEIPFKSPPFFATVFVTNMRGKIESLPVTLNIEDADGRVISTATGEISATSQVARNDVAEIAFPVPATAFTKVGHYKAVVLVKNEALSSRTFSVTNQKP